MADDTLSLFRRAAEHAARYRASVRPTITRPRVFGWVMVAIVAACRAVQAGSSAASTWVERDGEDELASAGRVAALVVTPGSGLRAPHPPASWRR
jgi:hypothetical protein